MHGKISIVVGGQFGSEAKGTVVGHVVKSQSVNICVRTGAINAGHTVYYEGTGYKMQQLPVGWVNPETKLVIGGGAYVHLETLEKEIQMINDAMPGVDVRDRIFIDARCGMHTDEHHKSEKGLHERMGSTGEGCGAALVDKISRRADYKRYGDIWTEASGLPKPVDTVMLLNDAYDVGAHILLEGTQGTGLDLHFGTYPYVTSRQTIASAWLAEAGLAPNLNIEVIMVVRTFPIRVAGNSGPFPGELNWSLLARRVNARRKSEGMEPAVADEALDAFDEMCVAVAKDWGLPSGWPHMWLDEQRAEHAEKLSRFHNEVLTRLGDATVNELKKFFETTTVTKKLRRVSDLDGAQLKLACKLNRPDAIALMFFNYEFPELSHAKTWDDVNDVPGSDDYREFMFEIEGITGSKIKYLNVNPLGVIDVPENATTFEG